MGLLRNVSLFMEILNVVSLVSMLVVVLLFVSWWWWQCGDNDVIFPLSKWGEWGGDGRGREATSLESEVRPGVSSALSISLRIIFSGRHEDIVL